MRYLENEIEPVTETRTQHEITKDRQTKVEDKEPTETPVYDRQERKTKMRKIVFSFEDWKIQDSKTGKTGDTGDIEPEKTSKGTIRVKERKEENVSRWR